ncbi:beta-galactosidase [Tessaracoccus rhinocerotis]|uniref:Beta-galactosidase n=1 Tax=Tessaracoccus rhinocerotis TaxID=1689449 RepID=A0A553K031_9ACTN|nr:beta-galactosidase [Tessaracoccus rhinocerotis]
MSELGGPRPVSRDVWFGGDYNPEQWSRTVLDEDDDLMRRARVNTATVGVFSWSSLEPNPGKYSFGWLDEALDRLHANGVRVVLATPTASPPPWFTRLHAEAMPVRADGVRLSHGSRDTYNPAAPAYREAARRITRVLAERYGSHPAVVLWHLHNEYGTVSHGPVTDVAFRQWLQQRYGTLADLNRTWNTAFWSQGYSSWDDVLALPATQYLPNPSQVLDFKRFSADLLRDCLAEQVRIVRELSPDVPTTTNFMLPTWNHYDQWAMADEIDVVSIDHYLDDEGPAGEVHVAFASDLARSFAGGRPWLLMEQSTSLVYDYDDGRMLVKAPGRIRRNTYQYLSRGAFGSLFFQWRAPLTGAEFFHSAMVPHAGADSRIFRELAALGQELAGLAEIVAPPVDGRVNDARVAIVWSGDAWWAAETPAMPSADVAFLPAVRAFHTALWRLGHTVDFVSPDADLSAHDVVLVPSLLPVSDEQSRRFADFVAAGGTLLVGAFSGSTDEHLRVRTGGYGGAFAGVLGVHVEEHVPLRSGTVLTLSDGSRAGDWSEVVHLRGADVVASYTDDAHPVIAPGSPAVTVNRHGRGAAHYFSTRFDEAGLSAHLARILEGAGAAPENPWAADGVEAVRRRSGASTHLFVINHSDQPRRVAAVGFELVTGTTVDGHLLVDAGDVRVVREDPAAGAGTP